MRKILFGFLKLLLLFIALLIPTYALYNLYFITWESPGLEGELQVAKELGINIVDLRQLRDLGVPTEISELERDPSAVQANAKHTLFLFLHGFNNTHLMAVQSANIVYKNLLKAQGSRRCGYHISPECRDKYHNRFLAFSWKGDFGDAGFYAAQSSADETARTFSTFVGLVSDWKANFPNSKVVLLAHSLGSRVALEGLCHARKSHPKQLVDILVLVQPAVSWHSVKTGLFRTTLFPDPKAPADTPYHEQAWREQGRYYDCIDSAREVVVITSPKDTVLMKYFSLSSIIREGEAPNSSTEPNYNFALGESRPNYGFRVSHSNYNEVNLGDVPGIKDLDHSGLFNDPAIMEFIWRWWIYPKFIPEAKKVTATD